jgi:hypothetical protein
MSQTNDLPTTEDRIAEATEDAINRAEDGHFDTHSFSKKWGQMVAEMARERAAKERPDLFEASDPSLAPVVSGPSNSEVKEIDGVTDEHPLVQETGDSALKTQTESGAGEFLSDFIYEHDKAWVREWLQNHETACVRDAKLKIRMSDEYPDGWLTHTIWISDETGETIIDYDDDQTPLADYEGDPTEIRKIEVPRPIDEVLEAARSLGYDPTIVWDVYRDERKIITEDNGIGMTPREYDLAFNTIFNSGSGVDGETGGQFGVGSESQALVTGKDGGATVETRSSRPGDYDGFRAYSYLGGSNALPGEVEEGFTGTRFILPVQENFKLSKLQSWVETYAEKLRVPLLYREHDAGATPVEEEYEATDFVDDYDDPPVVIERPGEFSLVAGPEVYDDGFRSNDENTFLVSMPIDRNYSSRIKTFWSVVIQIHDEQGRIIAGPNRGRYRDNVELHEDDVALPQPTGDRDRLQQDDQQKKFFDYIQSEVKEKELNEVGDIAQEMKEADEPSDVIRNNKSGWKLFKKMLNYHGSRRTLESRTRFQEFLEDTEAFPEYENERVYKMFNLFKEVEYCHRGPGSSSRKSSRTNRKLGRLLSNNDPEDIYMAASTSGNFTQRFRVARHNNDDAEVIKVNGSTKYKKWGDLYGFKVLKEVPLVRDDDHDYDIPKQIHNDNKRTRSQNRGKAEEVKDRALKIRSDDDNSSIDQRLTIEEARTRFKKGGKIGGHNKLVLFPRTEEANISDHYDFAKYAAIASVSKKEYEALADLDAVMTFEEYKKWSKSALIATEDGAMTPDELVDDDRMVILAYRSLPHEKKVVKLLSDDLEQLRTYYAEDIRDQYKWALALDGYDGGYNGDDVGNVPDSDKDDTLFAVADAVNLKRAEWAFEQRSISDRDMMGLKLAREKYKYNVPCTWNTLDQSTTRYRLMADTPNWDDESEVYDLFGANRDGWKEQVLLGFHDRGIDPTEYDNEKLREMV